MFTLLRYNITRTYKGGLLLTVLKNGMRYKLLEEQFQSDNNTLYNLEMTKSNERIFSFVYNHTDIYYLDAIDSKTLYNYIKFQMAKGCEKVSLCQAIKDVKHFLFFLEKIKRVNRIPHIDLSINNVSLWDKF
jgi:hypothetical protein